MGSLLSLALETFPGQPRWVTDVLPDLTGTITLVTGGNIGIGKETVKALLAHNATVYLAARNSTRAKAAIDELRVETGKEAIFLQCDLASLKSVKAAATEFMSKEKALHILYNNAGIMFPSVDLTTEDGYDLQWGTNVLGHFYLTTLLLPVLLATAQGSEPGKVRVVNTASSAAYWGRIVPKTFKDGPARRATDTHLLYGNSKLGNVVFSCELARRYGEKGITSTALHPGNFTTEMDRHMTTLGRAFIRMIQFPARYGALTQLWGGTTAAAGEVHGMWLVPWGKLGSIPRHADNPQLGREVWEWCEEQVQNI